MDDDMMTKPAGDDSGMGSDTSTTPSPMPEDGGEKKEGDGMGSDTPDMGGMGGGDTDTTPAA